MARRAILALVAIAVIVLGWRVVRAISLPSFEWLGGGDDHETAASDDEQPADLPDPASPAPSHVVVKPPAAAPAYDPWNPPPRDPFAPHLEAPDPPDRGRHFGREIHAAFMQHRAELRQCYRGQQPAPTEDLQVRMWLTVKAAPTGATIDPRFERLDDAPIAPELASCLHDVVASFEVTLPDDRQELTMMMPLTLTAAN